MVTRVGIIMNGVTGRMGYRQHLVRSILAIREQGGVALADGTRLMPDPILVGRNADKLAEIAGRHGIERWTTDLDEALATDDEIYFDAQLTNVREQSLLRAIAAGKDVYTEKPIAESLEASLRLARAAEQAGVRVGVVHDKLFLPGLRKLRRLVEGGFFGRVLSVRGEFGYWVWEGDWQTAQRPSWNYRSEQGGGIAVDMMPHWSYVLENVFGRPITAITARVATHIPERVDEQGCPYQATADDAAYALIELAGGVVVSLNSSWAVRVHRDELVEFQVDGTEGSAVAGLHQCVVQHRSVTPKPVWNPDVAEPMPFREQWSQVPDNEVFDNGFKAQWEQFLKSRAGEGEHPYDFMAGARGVRLAEAALQSHAEGRRIELGDLRLDAGNDLLDRVGA
ncbi:MULTISPECIES: Gfo/Idh/MocA family protein [Aestuariimicrobium]|uniref:Gfo/Idh/MocA family protein n=1 Tax=Aestuariimicrobium TaxID=396388 RepID=UPI0003B4F348|nr:MULTISPECIES: Gfo/Idh/MocA family oxidoreductase [Aestuariimicrobium]CAI9403749.1 D-xylose dehydrogenase [Aestuariimicrobium sp. T2.26MG-19.2B]